MQNDQLIESAVMQVLDDWMSAFNRQDLPAWLSTFHFPHYRLASGKMTVVNSADEHADYRPIFLEMGWHHSSWDHRHIIHTSETKVHVDTKFTRYREDGSVIATYESLYILTKLGGRWGVQLRSSFAP